MTSSAPVAPVPASSHRFDVAIVGAGPVGLALAGWLARRSATAALSVALVDARAFEATDDDPRALALSHGSRLLLDTLHWPSSATPIHRIHISQRGHFGRTVIDRAEHDLPALGYVVRYGALTRALATALDGAALQRMSGSAPASGSWEQDEDGVRLPIRGNASGPTTCLTARIVVNAEGRLDPARADASRDYLQSAVVGVVSVAAPQPHVAWERFTHEGPLALLPLGGADYALVWCGRPDDAARRVALSERAFLAELQASFGERMGVFTNVGTRAVYPLALNAIEAPVDRRVVAIGNAAQTLHPVAGQGLNLGLRDAHTLTEALSHHGATPAALSAFARRRKLDRRVTIGATDSLARLFTVEFPPLAALRGIALVALDFVPGVKTALARQMIFGQRR